MQRLIVKILQNKYLFNIEMQSRGSFQVLLLIWALVCDPCTCTLINTGIVKFDLNAKRESGIWSAQGQNGTKVMKLPASVPGGIYSDLEASQLLSSEIYHDYNDIESKWVGRTNWTFSRKFMVGEDLFSKSKIVLICEGLDTISKIYINEQLIGGSKNMFVRYIFDIKSALNLGENFIKVDFMSPVEYALNEYIKHEKTYGYPVNPPTVVPEFRGENKAQMIRKMQSSFSWDWGPSYASSGIWKNMYIEGLNSAVIRDVLILTSSNQAVPDETEHTEWVLTARVFFDVVSPSEQGTLTIRRIGGGSSTNTTVTVRINLSSERTDEPQDIVVLVPGTTAKLWWPNGLGKQNLYTYEIAYVSDTSETSIKTLRVGFRIVELIQDLVNDTRPEWGREFYFRVNGVAMYSKGSNSIPIHVLPEKVTKEQTKWLLESAKDLHSNMMRVWGGGIYESDYFYDLADELGIFIWEDFMFACAMYPANDEFLLNVVDEVKTQVKRLQHHPSLAIWAANNENEAALQGGWYATWGKFNTYKRDFIKLYVHTIIGNVSALDPSRQCLSSSPTNGVQSEAEGWVASNPGDARYGDIHHYDYYGDSWDAKTFKRRARYASEYGMQSFPYVGTLERIASNLSEWSWNSDMVQHRQRHPRGQIEMQNLIKSHLPYPQNFDSPEAFPAIIYMTQILQSMGQKTQTEFYRRLVDKLDPNDGTGHNMGALYWQLNDIWEGCSWASFGINGRWKMFASYMQRVFHPLVPSPYKDSNGDVVVELVSDSIKDFNGIMHIRVFKFNSMTPLINTTTHVNASYLTSKEVFRIGKNELEEIGCDKPLKEGDYPCVVYLTSPSFPDNFLLLHYPTNKTHLKNPHLRAVNYTSTSDMKTFRVTLESNEIAPFVFLNLKNHSHGKFSDNGFIMVDSPKTITYKSRDRISFLSFISQLDIMSLFDVTSVV